MFSSDDIVQVKYLRTQSTIRCSKCYCKHEEITGGFGLCQNLFYIPPGIYIEKELFFLDSNKVMVLYIFTNSRDGIMGMKLDIKDVYGITGNSKQLQ